MHRGQSCGRLADRQRGHDCRSEKGGPAAFRELWETTLPPHLHRLEELLGGRPGAVNAARGQWIPGEMAGELCLWAILHQHVLVEPTVLDATPRLAGFYTTLAESARVRRVLAGKSTFGPIGQYFFGPKARL